MTSLSEQATAPEWRTLPAGRELDAIVGRALGMTPSIDHAATRDGGESWTNVGEDRVRLEVWAVDMRARFPRWCAEYGGVLEVREREHWPAFSEGIDDAWGYVAAHCTARGLAVDLGHWPCREGAECRCAITDYRRWGPDRSRAAFAETAPLAIVRAFLLAREAGLV